jgi:cell shape-determining protein MreC
MSYATSQGKAYTLMDLERLAKVETFGQFTGAILGLIQRSKQLEAENAFYKKNALDAESYKSQLMELRREVNELKK